MNNEECKIKPVVININSNETFFYPYSILVNKYRNYVKLCVSDVVKNMNIKIFNQIQKLMKKDMYLGMKLVNVKAN